MGYNDVDNFVKLLKIYIERGLNMSKSFFKRLAAVSAAAAVFIPALNQLPKRAATVMAAPDEYHDDWLHVNDKAQIVDMNGNEVWLTGVNWFGYNAGRQVFDGVWSKNMHSMLNQIADHGFNLLRVPMSTQILLQWKNKGSDKGSGVGEVNMMVNAYENPELTVEGGVNGEGQYTLMYSFDIWNKAVEWCRENGMKIMIDIHSATSASMGHQKPLWYDDNFSEADWLEALEWFCDYYKDDDTIIAIDLKNEPHGKPEEGTFAKWDDSTDKNNWKYAAEKGAKACLKQNPNLLIMIEGIECYPDFDKGADWSTPCVDYAHYDEPSLVFGAWWGGNLRGVKKDPVDIGEYNKQIVYSPHDYGPLVWKQNWFYMDDPSKTFSRETLLKDYWYDTWAYLNEEHKYPLLMGEWGGFIDKEHDPTGENKHWMQELRDYMIDKRIHHTFWCFNENSGDTGGLVYDDFGKWDEEKYGFVKPSLWQTDGGKFIGLDHKIALGQEGNGVSLSDFYSSGAGSNMDGGTKGSGIVEPKTTTTTNPVTTTTTTTTATTSKTTTETTTTETTSKTTTSATTSTTVTTPQTTTSVIDTDGVWGDANGDGSVDMSDVVLIMQSLANPNKYGVNGTDKNHITAAGLKYGSVVNNNGSVTNGDALEIQLFLLGKRTDLTPKA